MLLFATLYIGFSVVDRSQKTVTLSILYAAISSCMDAWIEQTIEMLYEDESRGKKKNCC